MLLGHFKDEPGIGEGGPVVGETISERVARVFGESGNEGGGSRSMRIELIKGRTGLRKG